MFSAAKDIFGVPLLDNSQSRKWRSTDQELWSTYVTLSSRHTLLDDGILRFDSSARTNQWSLLLKPPRALSAAVEVDGDSVVPLNTRDVLQILGDDSIVAPQVSVSFCNFMETVASIYPYAIVVVEKRNENLRCDFSCATQTVADGLQKIRTIGGAPADALPVHAAADVAIDVDNARAKPTSGADNDRGNDDDDNDDDDGASGNGKKKATAAWRNRVAKRRTSDDKSLSSASATATAKRARRAALQVEKEVTHSEVAQDEVDQSTESELPADVDAAPVCSCIRIYLNDSMLGDLLKLPENDAMRDRVFKALEILETLRNKFYFNFTPPDIALEPLIPPLGPTEHFRLSLFPFQRRTVHWMLRTEWENDGTNEVDFLATAKTVNWHHYRQVEFSRKTILVRKSAPDPVLANTLSLHVRGGICCGRTGTGKTTSTIALIFVQKCLEASLPRCPRLPYQWHIPDNRLPTERSIAPNGLFHANCTLVVAPQQVVQQWHDEFVKTIGDGRGIKLNRRSMFALCKDGDESKTRLLHIGIVKDYQNLRELSLSDVIERLDVLIISKKIFTSSNYRVQRIALDSPAVRADKSMFPLPGAARVSAPTLSQKQKAASSSAASTQATSSSTTTANNQPNYQYTTADTELIRHVVRCNVAASAASANKKNAANRVRLGDYFDGLVLHAVHWRRIVTDEMHELDKSWTMIERAVAMLSADHVWGLTATPEFGKSASFGVRGAGGYPALMRIDHGRNLLHGEGMLPRWYFVNRCTTSSGCDEMPMLHMHRVAVQMSVVEMAIYSSIPDADTLTRLLFCSHHVLTDEQWLRLQRASANGNARGEEPLLSVSAVAHAMQSDRERNIVDLRAALANASARLAEKSAAMHEEVDRLGGPFVARLRAAVHPDMLPVLTFLKERTISVPRESNDLRRVPDIIEMLAKRDAAASTTTTLAACSATSAGDVLVANNGIVGSLQVVEPSAMLCDDDDEGSALLKNDDDNALKEQSSSVQSSSGAENNGAQSNGAQSSGAQNNDVQQRALQFIAEQRTTLKRLTAEYKSTHGRVFTGSLALSGPVSSAASVVVDEQKKQQQQQDKPLQEPALHCWTREQGVQVAESIDAKRKAVRTLASDVERLATNLRSVQAQYNFFDAVFKRLSNPDEVLDCALCLESDSKVEQVALTACGHEFCSGCARDYFFQHNGKACPTCRQQLVLPGDLRFVSRIADPLSQKNDEHDEKGGAGSAVSTTTTTAAISASSSLSVPPILIGRDLSKYGSKLKRLVELIFEIRARPDFAKLIVFAQFDRLLHLIGDALKDFAIDFVYVQGSIRQCESALRSFKHDPAMQIMLLSSETTISGVHLVEANHIIAVHPAYDATLADANVAAHRRQQARASRIIRGHARRGQSGEEQDEQQDNIGGSRINDDNVAYAKMWQAIGRIRRMTQTRVCHAWSLVSTDTVEQSLYEQQTAFAKAKHERDRNIVWDGDNAAAAPLNVSAGIDDDNNERDDSNESDDECI